MTMRGVGEAPLRDSASALDNEIEASFERLAPEPAAPADGASAAPVDSPSAERPNDLSFGGPSDEATEVGQPAPPALPEGASLSSEPASHRSAVDPPSAAGKNRTAKAAKKGGASPKAPKAPRPAASTKPDPEPPHVRESLGSSEIIELDDATGGDVSIAGAAPTGDTAVDEDDVVIADDLAEDAVDDDDPPAPAPPHTD